MKKNHFIIFIILLFLPLTTKGATLYLEPLIGDYHQNDIFLVEVRLDTRGESINAAKIGIKFPSEILEAKDFSKGNSILTLWTEEPMIEQEKGAMSFSGGVPGGYWGKNGLLGKIVFQVKDLSKISVLGSAEIKFLNDSEILLNDGLGSSAELITKSAIFNIVAGEGETENQWQKEIEQDKILPEPFKIELGRNPTIFEGKYFIIFSTTDKQTGIDRYEVKEGKEDWEAVNSPYVLKNQKLTSEIKVKAIDKAGNYWMETLEAQNKKAEWETYVVLKLVLILVILISVLVKRKLKIEKGKSI